MNVSARLAAAGNVPVVDGSGRRPARRAARRAMVFLRRLDRHAQGYFGALAQARSDKHWTCSCKWPH